MHSKQNPESILNEIANIKHMEKGTLSVIRQTAHGPVCNFQRWQKGRNHSEYVPADQVPQVEANLQSYTRFESLVADYVELMSAQSREARLDQAKKKRQIKKSLSPRKPKSKT